LAGTTQMENADRKNLRRNLQDEQDGLPIREQTQNGEALLLMAMCFPIL
jgi:hypothetical protein